jgi:hypothetical protein
MPASFAFKGRSGAALVALVLMAQPALARGFAGGGGFHGGGAPDVHSQPYTGRATSGGFDFSGDSAASRTTSDHYDGSNADHSGGYTGDNNYNHSSTSGYNNYDHNGTNNNGYNNHNNNGYNNHNGDFNNNGNFSHNTVVVNNPHGYSTWGWHGGVAWVPVGSYWGGGFWGAFAAGAIVAGTTAAIIAASTPAYPVTYVVAPSSPGYMLLTSYGLTQVPCGPNVVVMNYSGSTICARPNATVVAGSYSVNVGTLTLVSM